MLIFVLLGSIAAGLVQTVTGFGSGVVLMMFFPQLFGLIAAPAISSTINTSLAFLIGWRYRKELDYRLIFPSVFFYAITSMWSVSVVKMIDASILTIAFGFFLILLALYFLFVSNAFSLRGTFFTSFLCASFSGICAGFFGIGGPLMALYFLSLSNSHEYYLGNVQTTFAFAGLFTFAARVYHKIYIASYIPYTVIGLLGVFCGNRIGYKVSNRLDRNMLRKLIYTFVLISGVITSAKGLLALSA